MYELLDQHRMFHPPCLDDFANLKELMDRFEASTCEQYQIEKCLFRLFVRFSFCVDCSRTCRTFVFFQALDKIAAYMKSDRFMKTPVNNKMAKWGNKKE